MTNEEWIKKAGVYLPEGGYNIDTLGKCVFMFKEGYKSAIKDICEWLKEHMHFTEGIANGEVYYQCNSMESFLDDIKQAMGE